METRCLFLFVQIALFLHAAVAYHSSNDCVYTIYARTGSIIKGGSDSNISLTLGDSSGGSVWIPNLESWGLMGPNYDYYERGNVDIFSGRGACIAAPVCRLNVTSDGSGAHPSWYLDYVEVTATGPHRKCSQTIFYVNRWLSRDVPPFELTAVIDGCKEWSGPAVQTIGKGPLVLGKAKRSEA